MDAPADRSLMIRPRTFRLNRDSSPGKNWLGGDPVVQSFFNSLSIAFPRGEAFFVECVRPWQKHADQRLGADIAAFIRQEVAHGREHGAFNRGIIAGGYDTVRLEAVVDRVIGALRKKNAASRMTYTMCFEHLTAITASAILRDEALFQHADPEMRQLWCWHSVEEIEHKAVCFDTWSLATEHWTPLRRWLTRSAAMLLITAGFIRNRFAGQIYLLGQDGWKRRQSLPAILRSAFGTGSLGRSMARDWLTFFRPHFHPWQIDDRALIAQGEASFAPAAEPVSDRPATAACADETARRAA